MINPFKLFILFSFTLQAVPVNLKAAVPLQTSGEIKTIIPELDADEMALYETGKPGWIEVNGTRSFSKSISIDKAEQVPDKVIEIRSGQHQQTPTFVGNKNRVLVELE